MSLRGAEALSVAKSQRRSKLDDKHEIASPFSGRARNDAISPLKGQVLTRSLRGAKPLFLNHSPSLDKGGG